MEQWKAVKGFEGDFQVSSEGRVKAMPWNYRHWCGRLIPKPGGILKQSRHSGGYLVVSLRDNRKHYVHKLVMEAFVGGAAGRDVNHLDGNKKNNCLDNLEYCDRLHNVRHAITLGLQNNSGENNGMNKFTEEQITEAHRLVTSGASKQEASRASGVSIGVIAQVMRGTHWKHLNLTIT